MSEIPDTPTIETGSEITDTPTDKGSETTSLEENLTGQEVTLSQEESIENPSVQQEVPGKERPELLKEKIKGRLDDAKRIFRNTIGGPVQEYFSDMRKAFKDIYGGDNEKALYERTVGTVDEIIGITMEEYEEQMRRIQSRFQENEKITELGSKEKPWVVPLGMNLDTAIKNAWLGAGKGWGNKSENPEENKYNIEWQGGIFSVDTKLNVEYIDLSENDSEKNRHEETLIRMREIANRIKETQEI